MATETTEKFVKVGKVKDAHGIKGELFIVVFAGEAAWLDKLKTLRLLKTEEPGAEVRTLEVKSLRAHKNGFIAKTLDLKDRNEAESLCGWVLEIPEEFFVSAKGETLYLREIKDFKVFVKDKGEVGRISSFSSNGAQDLLVVKTSAGDFEIPFVKAYVQKIDHAAQEIHLDLPFGLLGEDDSGVDDSGADDSEMEESQ